MVWRARAKGRGIPRLGDINREGNPHTGDINREGIPRLGTNREGNSQVRDVCG